MTTAGREALRHGALLGALALALTAPGCDRGREVAAATPETAPERSAGATPPMTAPEPRFVTAASDEPISASLRLDSHLMVERNVGVTARRDGIVEVIHADRGDRVVEDQPLAELERGDLPLREEAAELALLTEESSFKRAESLYRQEVISPEEFEQARLRRDAALKELERIRYELSKCIIVAPFDGVISGRFIEKGQFIRKDDHRTLFQVTALRPLLARVYVPEWSLFGLRVGQEARVRPTAAPIGSPGRSPEGIGARVKWINHVVDPASATAEVFVQVLDAPPAERLRPGMSVAVEMDLTFVPDPDSEPLVSLPREALEVDAAGPGDEVAIRVLAGDGTVQTRMVELGVIGDRRVEVRRGLSVGERVVLMR